MKRLMIGLMAVSALAMAGCTTKQDIDDLYVFGKHDSTGLCFFGEDWDDNGAIDAGTAGEVPCTPAVEKWIQDRKRDS